MAKRDWYTHFRTRIMRRFEESHPFPPAMHGERLLWCEVIVQAICDLSIPKRKQKSKYKNQERETHRRQARVWLFGNSEDYIEVCKMAGICSGVVRELAMEFGGEYVRG